MSATENLSGSLRILLDTGDATPDLAATIESLSAHKTFVRDMAHEHAERIARLDATERGSHIRRSRKQDRMRAKLQAEEYCTQNRPR